MRFAFVATLTLALSSPLLAHAEPLKGLSHRDRLYDAAAFGDSLFVVGHPGRLLRSRDQGKTFESLSVAKHDEALFSIAFNTKGEGAIVGRSGFVLTTQDGGQTWKPSLVQLEEEKPGLFAVAVLEDGSIVAVGNFGVIVRSTDHGKTWSRSSYSVDKAEQTEAQAAACGGAGSAEDDNEGAIEEARLTDVRFVDDQHGFAVGEFGLIVASDDGGKTFKRQNSCTGRLLYGVAALGPKQLMAVGSDGTVVETKDAGATWSVVPTGITEHLFGVYADSKRALVVGAAGTVLTRESDGKLVQIPTSVHSWLASASLDSQGRGVIVGGRAYVLHTQDGGKTQQRTSGE
jgi:photosystem II stability/assembly factor-like uncharacterized protein